VFHWENIKWMATTIDKATYQPLAWLLDGIIYVVCGGLKPAAYHAASLCLHASISGLLCLVASRLFQLAQPKSKYAPACGLFAALLFSLHPLQAESVSWAASNCDLLASIFFAGAVLVYISGRIDAKRLAACWFLFLLSGLSRWKGVSLPLLLLILDAYPLKRRALAEKIPFFILSGAIIAINGLAKSRGFHYVTEFRPSGTLIGIMLFLSKWLAPVRLMPVYEIGGASNPIGLSAASAAVAVVALTTGLVVLRKRLPSLLAAWVFYLLALAPILVFAEKGAPIYMHDMHSYLACMGFALVVGAGLCLLFNRFTNPLPLFVVSVLLVLALGVKGRAQSGIWRNSEILWRNTLAIEPTSRIAILRLCMTLEDQGRNDEALALIRNQWKFDPFAARFNLVELYQRVSMAHAAAGRWPAALEAIRAAAALDPQSEVLQKNVQRAESAAAAAR
jgi:hypothetical protein